VSRFIDAHRGRFGVEPICRVLGVSASAYSHRRTGERSHRVVEDEWLLSEIERVHAANWNCYGYRRTWLQLKARGHPRRPRPDQAADARRRDPGRQAARQAWRTTRPDPAALRPPDRVERDFSAERPDRLWVADVTYVRCWEGMVYFSFVIDVFSRRIVGWQLASHMRTDLVLDALRMALSRRRRGADIELVHHSDAGSQYTSIAFTQVLDDHRVLGSIGSVGDAYDNALAESFVDSFKTELIADRVWRSRSQLELAIVEWVGWFNYARLHQALGDIPPAELEDNALSAITDQGPATPAHRD
jgi:putative transposase